MWYVWVVEKNWNFKWSPIEGLLRRQTITTFLWNYISYCKCTQHYSNSSFHDHAKNIGRRKVHVIIIYVLCSQRAHCFRRGRNDFFDIFRWWRMNERQRPIVYVIARDLLTNRENPLWQDPGRPGPCYQE